MNKRENERKERIAQIIVVLENCKERNISIEFNKFLYEIMLNHGVSKRTAKEYLDTAKIGAKWN